MKAGTVVIANFSGATGIKRRPALVISTALYQAERPDGDFDNHHKSGDEIARKN